MNLNFLISLPSSFQEWVGWLFYWWMILAIVVYPISRLILKGLKYLFVKLFNLIDRFVEWAQDQKNNKLYFDNESGRLAYVLRPDYYEYDGKRRKSDEMEEVRIIDSPGRHKKTREERVVYYRESGSGGGSVSTIDREKMIVPIAMLFWEYKIHNNDSARWQALDFLKMSREQQAKYIFRKIVSDHPGDKKAICKPRKITYSGMDIVLTNSCCFFQNLPTSVREVDYTI